MDIILTDVLATLWCAPVVDNTHPLQSTSAPGDNYCPLSCPPPAMMANEGMEVDVQTLPPTIVVSPVDPPTVDDAVCMVSKHVWWRLLPPILPSSNSHDHLWWNDCQWTNSSSPHHCCPSHWSAHRWWCKPLWSPSTSIDGHCPSLFPPSMVTMSGDGMPLDSNAISSPLIMVSPTDVSNTSLPASMVVVGAANTSEDMAMDMV